MTEPTIKKVRSQASPQGEMGQTYLASGESVSMRKWEDHEVNGQKNMRSRPYETVGYLIEGKAELVIGDQRVVLEAGDSWLVPADAEHRYDIIEPITAIEATSPPAEIAGRDTT